MWLFLLPPLFLSMPLVTVLSFPAFPSLPLLLSSPFPTTLLPSSCPWIPTGLVYFVVFLLSFSVSALSFLPFSSSSLCADATTLVFRRTRLGVAGASRFFCGQPGMHQSICHDQTWPGRARRGHPGLHDVQDSHHACMYVYAVCTYECVYKRTLGVHIMSRSLPHPPSPERRLGPSTVPEITPGREKSELRANVFRGELASRFPCQLFQLASDLLQQHALRKHRGVTRNPSSADVANQEAMAESVLCYEPQKASFVLPVIA